MHPEKTFWLKHSKLPFCTHATVTRTGFHSSERTGDEKWAKCCCISDDMDIPDSVLEKVPQSLKNSLIVCSLFRKKISSRTCRLLSSSKKFTWVLRASLMMSILRHATGISILFSWAMQRIEVSFVFLLLTQGALQEEQILTFSINKPNAVSTWANIPSKATKSIWPADILGVSSTDPFRGWISSPYWAWSTLKKKQATVHVSA